VLAAHGTLDSALLYVRFVVLTALYAAVALALAVAVSAVVRTTRQALAAVAVVFLTVAVGLDLGLVAVLAGSDPSVPGFDVLLAASPTSAYRGLVLESVVHVVSPRQLGPAINPVAALLGLLAWGVAGLGAAVVAVWGE
jgi:ABC-2 type transport system permease protein